jgi:hypothetical protein
MENKKTANAKAILTEESCIQKYRECKQVTNGEIPICDEFLKYAFVSLRQLEKVFGSSAYSKLQVAAGDAPNKFGMERTPIENIMQQYGKLVEEFGDAPPYPEWSRRDFRPTDAGIRRAHGINWSDMPTKFVGWAKENNVPGFDKALAILESRVVASAPKIEKGDSEFSRLIRDVRNWMSARRRNSEESYKVELRGHLESLKYELNEEFGESKSDLLVVRKYAIELKKDPDRGEYDRLFGQVARHLQDYRGVIVLILEATRKDNYDNFTSLVDRYLNNVDVDRVEVVKR